MKSNRERWRRWRDADWGVLLRCLWVIPAVELSVRWVPPRHWLPSSPSTDEREARSPAAAARGREIARWVDAAYRRSPFSPTCLTRSLVLYRILCARRIPCRLQIGLRRAKADLEGHAWVEPGRKDSEAAGFEVMLSF